MKIGYAALRDAVGEVTQSKSTQANMKSALSQWIDCFSLSWDSLPEKHLGNEFDDALGHYRAYLDGKNISATTRNDRSTLMRSWRRLYAAKRVEILAPDDFAGALTLAIKESGLSPNVIAECLGIKPRAIYDWKSGLRVPRRAREDKLRALEALLNLPECHLIRRIPSFYGDLPEEMHRNTTRFRASLRARRASSIMLGDAPEALKTEWVTYLNFKTRILPRGMRRSTSWRMKPRNSSPANYHWYACNGNMVCPSAAINYERVANILGFLVAPTDQGGLGLSSQVLTLATLADSDSVVAYLEYLKSRSGTHHGGTLSALQMVCSMLRPEYGYLWQNGEKFGPLYWHGALDQVQWRELCADAYYHLAEVRKHLLATGQVNKSRDPTEPISDILNRQHPITALIELAKAMELKQPYKTWGGRRAVFMRDLLLIKLLTVNPLRIHNICIMTYRKDNTGNIFQMPDGSWWLRYDPKDFKNQRGAAKKPYLARLAPSIWKDIDDYLALYRPLLAGAAETDFVFRPKVSSRKTGGSRSMIRSGELGTQLQKWTHQFILNCPGFRAHAFRHIIATDFIKNHPQSYMVAASILHDKIETVMENYAHLKKSDDFEVYNNYLGLVMCPVPPVYKRV